MPISPKQTEIMKVLEDDIHTEIFMGGAAGGAKSFTGCLWQILRRLKYPRSRGFLARARLKSLKESTLLTFFDVCRLLKLEPNKDYTYNAIYGIIRFSNGSEEYLKDLFLYPSDPEFVSLGSTEFTDGFIDEMAEITEQAYQIIRSRMRYKLDEFGLIPKIAMGSNPCKTFIYREFYKKWLTKTLEPYKAYVRASVYDNPFISDHYIINLKRLDSINRARLLDGNWEYDDDPNKIFDYDRIIDIFTNDYVLPTKHENYITCDVARKGDNLTVALVWNGLFIKHAAVLKISPTKKTRKLLENLAYIHKVPRSNIIIDEDGIGGGVIDEMEGVKGFIANSRPVENEYTKKKHNYANLKAQCYFKLAEIVNDAKMGCYKDIDFKHKGLIVEDLEQVAQKDADKDTTIKLITKEEMKLVLQGRSPDFGDAMMMRMYFEVNPVLRPYISL